MIYKKRKRRKKKMFNISGKKTYKVTRVSGGISSRGQAYTVINIEDEPKQYQKFGDRLTVNIWGEDISNRVKKDDKISLTGALEVGYVFKKNPNDPNGKGYENLTVSCTSHHIHLSTEQEDDKTNPLEFAQDDLPF